MKILHRYILSQFLRTLGLCLAGLLLLFLVFDFMDRIDNILSEDVSVWTVLQYFLFKIPFTLTLMLPVAGLASTLLVFGLLSKNSEITAMRSTGVKIIWLAKPVLIAGAALSLAALVLNETLVPYSQKRVKEIYNIDIRQKDQKGGYSESNIWWRDGNNFFSAGFFDSRVKNFLDLVQLRMNNDFRVEERINTTRTRWVNKELGWTMEDGIDYLFDNRALKETTSFSKLPLPISKQPKDLFDFTTDPETMSFRRLRKFIKEQAANGIAVGRYMADMHEKIAFPFINFVVILVALPFALTPARSGSMAGSFTAGMILGFTYYAVHSFSIALGRAELYPPLLAAWMANILLGIMGIILNLGAESPS